MKVFMILLLLTVTQLFAEPYSGTIRNFVGINSNVGAYDDNIVERLSRVAKWMREYHSWGHYERTNDTYLWDHQTNSSAGTWPHHTRFIEQCLDNDMNVLICAQGSTDWIAVPGADNPSASPPIGEEDGTEAMHYLEKVEFVAQLAARYGSTKIEANQLETTDKKSGLNYVTYFEDWNEPDQSWWDPIWPGDMYGVYVNAVHDGANLTPSDDYPLLGIKSVDPNAMHVMGGMAGFDEDYLDGILKAAGGRVPFDIINFHTYCTQGWGTNRGICPEHETFGLKQKVDKWMDWRDTHAPGMPIWLTEFGWDTYKNGNSSSYVYAGEESQANYLLRSIFLLMGYGIDKAFVFFDKDPNSTSTQQYSSSGLLTDKENGLEAKPSYYYLATMQNRVGEYYFDGIEKYAEGDPEVYMYRLREHPQSEQHCYVVWCRNGKSKYDDGTTVENIIIAKPDMKDAVIVEPMDEDEYGVETALDVQNAGTESAFVVIPTVTEKPIFVFSKHRSLVKQHKSVVRDFRMHVYPNPFNSEIKIHFDIAQISDVTLALYDINGRLVDSIHHNRLSAGQHLHRFDFSDHGLSTGVYLVQLRAGKQVLNQKICHVK